MHARGTAFFSFHVFLTFVLNVVSHADGSVLNVRWINPYAFGDVVVFLVRWGEEQVNAFVHVVIKHLFARERGPGGQEHVFDQIVFLVAGRFFDALPLSRVDRSTACDEACGEQDEDEEPEQCGCWNRALRRKSAARQYATSR